MKQYILKALSVMLLAMTALPLLAQDSMNVFFKDGSNRKFYLKDITELFVSKTDSKGIVHVDQQYQHISTADTDFVYDLSDVDSITFKKYNEEKAEENFVTAIPEIISSLSNCETISDAESMIETIKGKNGVEDVWSDGHQLYVKIEEGEVIPFHYSHYGNDDEEETRVALSRFMALEPELKRQSEAVGNTLKIVIADQQNKDEDRKDSHDKMFNELTSYFERCGHEVKYVKDPTVDFFFNNSEDQNHLNFYDYDVILLSTHGGYGEYKYYVERDFWPDKVAWGFKTHSIATSEDILFFPSESEDAEDYPRSYWKDSYETFRKWRNNLVYNYATDQHINFTLCHEIRDGKWCWVLHPTISECFFRDIAEGQFRNPNSLLFNAACQSLKGDEEDTPSFAFANVLFEKCGLGVYAGYTETNCYGQVTGVDLLESMTMGYSIDKAYDNLPDVAKLESVENAVKEGVDKAKAEKYLQNARLLIKSKGERNLSSFFLSPSETVGIDATQVEEQFKANQNVALEGMATSSIYGSFKEKGFKFGFFFGSSPDNLSSILDATVVPMTSNSNKGNVLFRAITGTLEQGNTYYYQAYTHDGASYNLGDICKFQIPYADLQLHVSEISLEVGTTGDVVILQGSGNYTVKSDNSDVAEATVDIDHVHIISYVVGNAVITVTDVLSGKTATIQVKVSKPAEVPANAIDLGLPSGTLWASYNVGARNPEEYGDYYAWGEIDTKDSYTWSNYIHCDGTKETCHYIGADFAGTDYDVAHKLWGDRWTTPTKAQIDELTKQCTKKWTMQNGVKGCRITGPNGNSIFLPAAGFAAYNNMPYKGGEYSIYMSSTACDDNYDNWCLDAEESSFVRIGLWRYYGYTVRPVISPEPEIVENADQPLDLGLTSGTLWAQCNLGASQPHEFGNYYAWGETKPKEKYDKASYSLYNSSTDTYTDIGKNISGTEYDAAYVTLGGTWHMPTYAEFTELKDECEWKYTVMNGVNGYRVTGPNGNSIFIPCADIKEDESAYPAPPSDTDGFYWSSMRMNDARYTLSLHFNENGAFWPHGYLNFMGFSIRPVMTK